MIKNYLTTVDYKSVNQSNSWSAYAEKAAAVCIAPAQWLVNDLFGVPTKYVITKITSDYVEKKLIEECDSSGLKKLLRVVAAIVLVIPGAIGASAFRFVARRDREIELKHQVVRRNLSNAEKQELFNLVEARKTLANEKQGEPVSCILCCICMLLCCLVCQGRERGNR